MLGYLRFPQIVFVVVVITQINSYGFFNLCLLFFSSTKKASAPYKTKDLTVSILPQSKAKGQSWQYPKSITQILSPRLYHPFPSHNPPTPVNLMLSKLSFSHMKAFSISCYQNSVIRFSLVTFCSKTKINKIKAVKFSPNQAFVSPVNDTHNYKMLVPSTWHIKQHHIKPFWDLNLDLNWNLVLTLGEQETS